MAILGKMIKGFLDLRDKLAPETDPVEAQHQMLRHLLETARNTAFGKHYHFIGWLCALDRPDPAEEVIRQRLAQVAAPSAAQLPEHPVPDHGIEVVDDRCTPIP
jgi:hypothetical protein